LTQTWRVKGLKADNPIIAPLPVLVGGHGADGGVVDLLTCPELNRFQVEQVLS
jgi:hypothetical protein